MRQIRITHGGRGEDILDEEDALRFNDDEVEKLVEVANDAVDSVTRDGVVATRA